MSTPFAGPDGLTILDGSMGQELIEMGAIEATELWATEGLVSNPEAVVALHRAYIDTGVDVITTNSYSVTQDRFARFDMTDRFAELLRLAGELAVRARDESGRDVAIAASLPPLQGSYRADLARAYDIDLAHYREIVEHIDPYVDLFLAETMTTLDEARAAADAARGRGKPVWVAWTVQNGGPDALLSGESWAEAVAAVPADAHLVNCSGPEATTVAVGHLAAALGERPFGAYANAFEPMAVGWSNLDGDPLPGARADIDEATYAAFAREWIDLGATIIGGCCEIGRRHMTHLCGALRAAR